MARYGTAVLGGTFDRFHVGHEALLATAFGIGRAVAIGLTTPEFLAEHPKPDGREIQPFATRRRALAGWIRRTFPGRPFRVVPLRDPFGGSVGEGVDVLVVSADTIAGGRAVNRERRRCGLRALPLVVVPLVLADDLGPVSSRRIRAGEIDRQGRRVAAIRVGVSAPPEDRAAAERGVRLAFRSPRIRFVAARPSGRRPLSRGEARTAAVRAARGRDLGVAVVPAGQDRRWVGVASPRITLNPRLLSGRLDVGLGRLLRPTAGRKDLGGRRPSSPRWRRTSA